MASKLCRNDVISILMLMIIVKQKRKHIRLQPPDRMSKILAPFITLFYAVVGIFFFFISYLSVYLKLSAFISLYHLFCPPHKP